MKKNLFLFVALLVGTASMAQWLPAPNGIHYSNGKVSINTIYTSATNDVYLTIHGSQVIYGLHASQFFGGINNTTDGYGEYGIEYNEDAAGLNFWKPSGSNGFKNWVLFLGDNGDVGIGTKTLVKGFKLTVDGNITARRISIGTVESEWNYLLTVAGGIHAREVLVTETAGGADFVFEDDFELRSLPKLEEFVNQNKHLPDVPSSEQMEENGLDIAKFQINLLQKVEELTLYIIEQQKEIEELKARISINHEN